MPRAPKEGDLENEHTLHDVGMFLNQSEDILYEGQLQYQYH